MTIDAHHDANGIEDVLPLDAHTQLPLQPRRQPGYYPGFSTLGQKEFWDEATRVVVTTRVEQVPEVQFFSKEEQELMAAILDRVIPQDDRTDDRKIPVLNYVDERLYSGRTDGYRYEDMPPDREAYQLGLTGIEAGAQTMYGRSFTDLGPLDQDAVLWTLHQDKPQGGDEIWKRVPCDRFWILLVSDAVDAYYAHPYAWDEVGFGGPAYPRGYFRLEYGLAEPWEVDEQRYDWDPPPTSTSDQYKQLGGRHPHTAPAGQGGTH
ncbi:MAG: gluconate 2-dehydrogenase subunit 3 family protein [Chloroflexota bacterium]